MRFVLVHGSGAGGWCWDALAPLLRARGHEVHAPSLSGLEDPATGLERHVEDVVAVLEEHDLRGVQLVGHSYGGMPITGAAERVPERLARLVYLDASVPRDGECMLDTRPDLRDSLAAQASGGLIPPLDPWFAGVETEEQARLLRERLTTTPLRCYEDRLSLKSAAAARIPRSFIWCTRSGYGPTAARARAEGWDVHQLDAPHMAMLTAPEEVASLLLEIAERPAREP